MAFLIPYLQQIVNIIERSYGLNLVSATWNYCGFTHPLVNFITTVQAMALQRTVTIFSNFLWRFWLLAPQVPIPHLFPFSGVSQK